MFLSIYFCANFFFFFAVRYPLSRASQDLRRKPEVAPAFVRTEQVGCVNVQSCSRRLYVWIELNWLQRVCVKETTGEATTDSGAAALGALGNSENISNVTCGICMDNVYEKNQPRNNLFGILPNCNHAFCIECISTWRKVRDYGPEVIK